MIINNAELQRGTVLLCAVNCEPFYCILEELCFVNRILVFTNYEFPYAIHSQ